MEKEIITTIGLLEEGDRVMGTDGKWHDIKILPVHIPDKMYKIFFSNGSIKCSGEHQWSLFGDSNLPIVMETDAIFENFDQIKDLHVGNRNGPMMESIENIDPEPVRCIHILDSDDQLFEILVNIEKNIEDIEVELVEKI